LKRHVPYEHRKGRKRSFGDCAERKGGRARVCFRRKRTQGRSSNGGELDRIYKAGPPRFSHNRKLLRRPLPTQKKKKTNTKPTPQKNKKPAKTKKANTKSGESACGSNLESANPMNGGPKTVFSTQKMNQRTTFRFGKKDRTDSLEVIYRMWMKRPRGYQQQDTSRGGKQDSLPET